MLHEPSKMLQSGNESTVGIGRVFVLFFGPGSFGGSRDHHYPHAAYYSRDVQLTQYHRDWDYRHLLYDPGSVIG